MLGQQIESTYGKSEFIYYKMIVMQKGQKDVKLNKNDSNPNEISFERLSIGHFLIYQYKEREK